MAVVVADVLLQLIKTCLCHGVALGAFAHIWTHTGLLISFLQGLESFFEPLETSACPNKKYADGGIKICSETIRELNLCKQDSCHRRRRQ